jgi:prepilin peptidase CpaA
MPQRFFPDSPAFSWAFCLCLIGVTAMAAYVDWRRQVIPKAVTVPALLLGVAASIVRGLWLENSSEGAGAWHGALDGFLFALAGFAVGFGLFLVLWLLGTCQGGDVKLFAAMGAWLGPTLTLLLLLLTVILVGLSVLVRWVWRLFRGQSLVPPAQGGKLTREEQTQARRLRQRLVYAPSLVVATTLLLLWIFRVELRLVAPVGL